MKAKKVTRILDAETNAIKREVTRRYRVRIGRNLWLHELAFKGSGKTITCLKLGADQKKAIVFKSTAPKGVTTKDAQRMREAICNYFGNMSWSQFHFVEA